MSTEICTEVYPLAPKCGDGDWIVWDGVDEFPVCATHLPVVRERLLAEGAGQVEVYKA